MKSVYVISIVLIILAAIVALAVWESNKKQVAVSPPTVTPAATTVATTNAGGAAAVTAPAATVIAPPLPSDLVAASPVITGNATPPIAVAPPTPVIPAVVAPVIPVVVTPPVYNAVQQTSDGFYRGINLPAPYNGYQAYYIGTPTLPITSAPATSGAGIPLKNWLIYAPGILTGGAVLPTAPASIFVYQQNTQPDATMLYNATHFAYGVTPQFVIDGNGNLVYGSF